MAGSNLDNNSSALYGYLTFTTCFPSITNASIDKRQSLYINSNNNEFKY